MECGFRKILMKCDPKVVTKMITIRFIVIILIGGWEITKKHNLDKGNTCTIKGQCNVISKVRSLSSKLISHFQLGLTSTRHLTISHLLMSMRAISYSFRNILSISLFSFMDRNLPLQTQNSSIDYCNYAFIHFFSYFYFCV